jgi:hypothetical protein
MFAWRKPRPEEEEPLVPHGMIWQATEEPMAPNQAERRASGSQPLSQPTQDSTEPREFPWDFSERRSPLRANKKPAQSPGEVTPKTTQPLQWPLPRVQELTKRRFQIQEERASGKAVEQTAEQPTQNEFWINPDEQMPTTTSPSIETSSSRQAARPPVPASVPELQSASTSAAPNSSVFKQQVQLLRAGVLRRSAEASVVLSHWRDQLQSTVPAIWSSIRSSAGKVEGRLYAKAANWSDLTKRVFSYRVRLRIQPVQQIRALAKPLQNLGTDSLRTNQRNSRLATSMGMAGLSALLALALVLTVRRYQPTPVGASSEPVKVNSASTASVTPAATGHHGRPAKGTVKIQREPIVRASTIERDKPTTKPARRRSHHNPDEDYVARDTTTYYKRH